MNPNYLISSKDKRGKILPLQLNSCKGIYFTLLKHSFLILMKDLTHFDT